MAQITITVPDHPAAALEGPAVAQFAPIDWQGLFARIAPAIIQAVLDQLRHQAALAPASPPKS